MAALGKTLMKLVTETQL